MVRKRGQVIVATALILALLMLAISTSLHFTSTTYQKLYYYDTKEVVDNINQDLNRLLSYILVCSSNKYFEGSESLDNLRIKAYDNLTFWLQSIIVTYSTKGIQLKMDKENILTFEYENVGLSQIKVNLCLNLTYLNFYNWEKNYTQYLKISDFIITPTYDQLSFKLCKENNLPAEIFDSKSCWIYLNGVPVEYTSISATSPGLYVVSLKNKIPKPALGQPPQAITLYVKDKRGVFVGMRTYLSPFASILLKERPAFFYSYFSSNNLSGLVIKGMYCNGTMLCPTSSYGNVSILRAPIVISKNNDFATKLWIIQKIYGQTDVIYNNITVFYSKNPNAKNPKIDQIDRYSLQLKRNILEIYKNNFKKINSSKFSLPSNYTLITSMDKLLTGLYKLELEIYHTSKLVFNDMDTIPPNYGILNLTLSFGYRGTQTAYIDDLIISTSKRSDYYPLNVTFIGTTGMAGYVVEVDGKYNNKFVHLESVFDETCTARIDLANTPIIQNAEVKVYFLNEIGEKIMVAYGSFDIILAGDYYYFGY
ncbi:MAG: hypothetical protein QXF82_04025 [Nitrososphaeria archaeon]